ncbi:hypothetical protein [Antarcticirhabdus aurantiaca]|nr:hypothetical protein [Antarcticirhabdus aurantiaca]
MADLDDVRLLWAELARRGFPESLGEKPLEVEAGGARIVCRKPLGLLMATGGDLGIIPRLLCIEALVGEQRGTFFGDVAREARKLEPDERRQRRMPTHGGNIQKIVQIAHHRVGGFKLRRFERGISTLVARRRGLPSLDQETERAMFGRPFVGPDAIDAYVAWLRGDAGAVDGSQDPPTVEAAGAGSGGRGGGDFLMSAPDRAGFAAWVEGALAKGAGKPTFVNIHGKGLWFGLSACARWVGDLAREERRTLLLPTRTRTASGGFEILNISQVLGRLRAFAEGRDSGDAGGGAPMSDADGLFDVVHRIRLSLAERPAILVFDGHHVDDRMTLLERRIADDYLDSLWARLLEPPMGGDPTLDLATFRDNRIVVTSNERLDEVRLKRLARVPGAVSPQTFRLPILDGAEWSGAVDRNRVHPPTGDGRDGDTIGHALRRVSQADGFKSDGTDAINLVEAVLSVALELDPDRFPARVDELVRRFSGRRLVIVDKAVEAFLAILAERSPLWLEIALVVSMTPDGLRPGTLRRLARAGRTVPWTVLPEMAASEGRGELAAEIDRLCGHALPILGLVRNDAFEGLDGTSPKGGSSHPLEYGLSATDGDDTSARSVDYLFPETKLLARDAAARRLSRRDFHAVHRLLAEDALTQQTISLRHLDNTGLQSIRPWRRMLSVIYSGLQSIPVSIDASGAMSVDDDLEFGTRSLVTSSRPSQFWLYLYAFCYRRLIENPPAWNLSRLYGLDELKGDILTYFDEPWQLWPKAIRPDPAPPMGAGLVEWMGRLGRGFADIPADHRAALAQSYLAVGEVPTAEGTLLSAPDVGTSSARASLGPEIPHGAFKRLFEIRLLSGESIDAAAVESRISRALTACGDGEGLKAALDEALERQARRYLAVLRPPDPRLGTATPRLPPNAFAMPPEIGEVAARLGDGRSAAAVLHEISDVYARLGELGATVADLAGAAGKLNRPADVGSSGEGRLPIMRAFLSGPEDTLEERIDELFCSSFARLVLSEQLRLATFSMDPLGIHYLASGNAARQIVRVALKLEGRRSAAKRCRAGNEPSVFSQQARRTLDGLSRNLFRFSRERSAQIVLEATMLRLLSNGDNLATRLRIAEAFLAEADALLVGLGRRVRAGLRLRLERAKMNRTFVENTELEEDERRRRLLQWEFDVNRLRSLAEPMPLPLWRILARLQHERFRRYRDGVPAPGVG